MRDLHVGAGVTWPARLATTATALLGIRGAGKSNLARVIAEEAYRSKIPVVVFDPVGNWYGIRAGKDGKPEGGLPFAIFGGRHGDVPLEAGAGQLIADTIIDTRLSCVIDMSHEDFSEGDKCRFLTAFGDRLFRRKQPETGWILLVLEEADDYAPQARGGGGGVKGPAAATLGVFQRLVKRCRSKGLGALLVTQRSAALNKDLLNMADTLVAFRTTAPHDQDAVEGWIKHHSLSAEAMKTISGLPAGEAWVWSPEALGTFERTKFRRMDTLDTGRTPEHVAGKAAAQPTLADVDLPGLRKKMADTIERAKAEDPRELRKKLSEQAQVIRTLTAAGAEMARAKPGKTREVPILKDSQVKRLEALATKMIAEAERHGKAMAMFWENQDEGWKALLAALRAVANVPPPRPGYVLNLPAIVAGRASLPGGGPAFHSSPLRSTSAPREGLTGTQQSILNMIATLDNRGLAIDRVAVARWLGIHPNGGRFLTDLARLREAGHITPNGVALTNGSRALATPDIETGPKALLDRLASHRKAGTRHTMMVTILQRGPFPSRLELAGALGIHPNGGRFLTDLARLREMGVIPEKGEVRATEGALA